MIKYFFKLQKDFSMRCVMAFLLISSSAFSMNERNLEHNKAVMKKTSYNNLNKRLNSTSPKDFLFPLLKGGLDQFGEVRELVDLRIVLNRGKVRFKKLRDYYYKLIIKIDLKIADIHEKRPLPHFPVELLQQFIFKGQNEEDFKNIKLTCMKWYKAAKEVRRNVVVKRMPSKEEIFIYKNSWISTNIEKLSFYQQFSTSLDAENIEIISKIFPNIADVNLYNREETKNAGFEYLKNFKNLTAVYCCNMAQTTDVGLEHLKHITKLRSLELFRCLNITNTGLEHLKNLTNLQSLSLQTSYTITDAGLVHLVNLTNLRSLNLGFLGLKDSGLSYLSGLTNLQYLSLAGCQMTDIGVSHLNNLTNLQELLFSHNSKITDASFVYLKKLEKLKELCLVLCNKITDAGLSQLENLKNFTKLNFRGTNITHVGLAHIKNLEQLKELDLYGCPITLVGQNTLRKKLPSCQITF